MIVKVPDQRQWLNDGDQQRFNDLLKYLLEKFGLEQTSEFLYQRYGQENHGLTHAGIQPHFTDILSYAAGDLSLVGASPSDSSLGEQLPDGQIPNEQSTVERPSNEHSPLDPSLTGHSPNEPNGKCVAVEVHGVTHLCTAIAEMNAVALKNLRVKDPAFHFILSWPENERPPKEQVFDAARHAIAALGLSEHQYMLAIHDNTDNLHCHIAVNRVHPVTFKSQHLSYSWETLHYAAREAEIKHGWSHDKGMYLVQQDEHGDKRIFGNPQHRLKKKLAPPLPAHLSSDQSQAGISPTEISRAARSPIVQSPWTDPDSLISWLRTSVSPLLKRSLPDLSSWQDLHQFLSPYNVTLKNTGGGGMRLTATDASTGEVLDVPASKALRHLKRGELEARWGAFQPPAASTNPAAQKKVSHAKNIPDFDEFDRFAPHPEGARRERLRDMRGEHVASGRNDPEMLLPRDAPDHMEHDEADFDSRLRHGSDGTGVRRLAPSPTDGSQGGPSQVAPSPNGTSPIGHSPSGTSTTVKSPGDPFRFDPSKSATSKRDPSRRAERREARTAERIALRRRYQEYRATIRETNLTHQGKMKVLREVQRVERTTQTEAFREARQLLRGPLPKRGTPEYFDPPVTPELAVLAANHSLAKQFLRQTHRAQQTELTLTRLPALTWRDWLLEQAQLGDQPALSALRGIVYQARRDANLSAAPSPVESSPSANSSKENRDPALAAYYDFIDQLREEEKRELAIRSVNANQARPHQCDPLLIKPSSHMTYRVTGNGNVMFFDLLDKHLFTDRGNRLTFDRERVTDDELRLALLHAREKFGHKLTLTGDDPVFTARMAKMADDLGLQVLNPELQAVIADHREAKRQTASTPAVNHPPETAPASTHPATTIPQSLHPESTTPQSNAQLVRALPVETSLEALRQELLAAHPRATFVTADPRRTEPHIGRIVATKHDAFAQRVGRSIFALHGHPVPKNLSASSKASVHIQYSDGLPVHVAAPAKIKGKGSGRA